MNVPEWLRMQLLDIVCENGECVNIFDWGRSFGADQEHTAKQKQGRYGQTQR